MTVQGPTNYKEKMESQKACTMGMPMNNGDISTTKLIEQQQAEESHRKFLYDRAIHSNHMIQHHMHQIMEHQRVIDKYRNMMNEGRDLIPLESSMFKTDPAVISHIMYMINMDDFFGAKRLLGQSLLSSGGAATKK